MRKEWINVHRLFGKIWAVQISNMELIEYEECYTLYTIDFKI